MPMLEDVGSVLYSRRSLMEITTVGQWQVFATRVTRLIVLAAVRRRPVAWVSDLMDWPWFHAECSLENCRTRTARGLIDSESG
jgi:hypothetical protein